jgi:hypothetical protein
MDKLMNLYFTAILVAALVILALWGGPNYG